MHQATENPALEPATPLPARLRDAIGPIVGDEPVLAWSGYDVGQNNHYCQELVVLTPTRVVCLANTSTSVPVSDIASAKIVEGLGVDRLRLLGADRLLIELRYTRKCRREMTRLHRKLQRMLPSDDGKAPEARPDWLESIERQIERQEHCPNCGQLIPAWAENVCPHCLRRRKILWRLLDVAKPYRRRIWLALSLTMVVSVLAVLPPIFNKHLMDDAITGRSLEQLFRWSAALLGVIILSELIGGWRMRVLARVGTRITADLRHMIYAHLHDLSLRYFAKRRTGSLITRVTSDTERLWDFVVFGSVSLIRDVAMIICFAAAMLYLNWRLALFAVLPLPILGVITYYRSMKMQAMFGRLWGYWSRMTAVVGDALPGVRVVKAFANEAREVRRFDRRSDEYADKENEIHVIWTQLQPIVSGLMRFGALLIWVVGGYIVIRWPEQKNALGNVVANKGNTLGTLIAFTQFTWQFYQPIMELANSNRMVTRAASSAQRVFEVLDTPPEVFSQSNAVTLERLEGRIEFRNVSFSYEGAQPALRDVSLLIEPGEMIGLCGPSGAGKSTFVNLICRFYDVTDGQILIDGRDIRDYDVKWLRRNIGMVLQEPYLFHGTIAENIRYGNPEAMEADIIRAARAANAHDFIVGFPDGYDTMVGERGQSLSGGERQRISIARAILHNPRILILDEATSSVDTETEKQIQQALDRLVEGRTTVAIAHRLSTLQAADRLVVLEKGRIVEQGVHSDLVEKPDGVYAKLHKTQMEMATMVAIR